MMPHVSSTDQPGETAPGAATDDTLSSPLADVVTPEAINATQTYRDDANRFSVGYPADLTVLVREPGSFAALEPRPRAVVAFMNPVAANSDNPDLEPADLEVRTFPRGDAQSLAAWLQASGLLPADGSNSGKQVDKTHVSGIEVCASTMIAPGCALFVLGDAAIYQLIPATIAGEQMLDDFSILS